MGFQRGNQAPTERHDNPASGPHPDETPAPFLPAKPADGPTTTTGCQPAGSGSVPAEVSDATPASK